MDLSKTAGIGAGDGTVSSDLIKVGHKIYGDNCGPFKIILISILPSEHILRVRFELIVVCVLQKQKAMTAGLILPAIAAWLDFRHLFRATWGLARACRQDPRRSSRDDSIVHRHTSAQEAHIPSCEAT
jgi:hypothetical protein